MTWQPQALEQRDGVTVLAKSGKRKGRPPRLLDEKLRERIIYAIKVGMYIDRSFTLVGIHPNLYDKWAGLAAEGREPYNSFWVSLQKAEAEAELECVELMRKGGNSFVPHATLLERRFRDRWGRSDRVEMSGTVTVKVEVIDFAKYYSSRIARNEPKLVNPPGRITDDNKA